MGALAGFHFFPALSDNKLGKPTVVGIGAGGKGTADINGASKAGFQVIGLVDVIDSTKLAKLEGRLRKMGQTRQQFPDAKFFTDYREMFSEMGDQVDAVTVSTPDHHHFHASALAMQAGKHVYCQKPLTHGTWEARQLNQLAKHTGVKTQMGNQAHANDHMRRCVELIRSGVIGKVKEIHAWTNRPIWPQGFASPPSPEPVPLGIDWEQWVGPAPWVDYNPRIAPFAWRGWWNYGTGALGDMACHIMDLGYWSMQPDDGPALAPQAVTAKQNGATEYSPPSTQSSLGTLDRVSMQPKMVSSFSGTTAMSTQNSIEKIGNWKKTGTNTTIPVKKSSKAWISQNTAVLSSVNRESSSSTGAETIGFLKHPARSTALSGQKPPCRALETRTTTRNGSTQSKGRLRRANQTLGSQVR